ncbi:MAG: isocitrate/isopropylmalate dehydrogenase family protein [Gammaproteobacteria bacterium]
MGDGRPLNLVILPGDGIGPEIAAVAVDALTRLNERFSLALDIEQHDIGLTSLGRSGSTLPGKVLEAARAADGVVLGPVSTYEYPPVEQGGINPSAAIRIALDLYANIRPARTRPGVPCVAKRMDLVVVRENTEGFYADRNMHSGSAEFLATPDTALAIRKITRQGSRRIARSAFELARRRRRKVTAVHKANVLRLSDGLFLEEVRAVASDYPQVALEERIVDAMAALLIRQPEDPDVIVTTNMFGDILSDQTGEMAGGLGLAPALNAGDGHAVAQATHGSAPDIAGQGIANPSALLLSVAMLLEWLGARHSRGDVIEASNALRTAVDQALADPLSHTPDIGGNATTTSLGAAVVKALMR